jgi:hypothetical protein
MENAKSFYSIYAPGTGFFLDYTSMKLENASCLVLVTSHPLFW